MRGAQPHPVNFFIYHRFTAVLSLEEGAYPENSPRFALDIKLSFILIVYVFGSRCLSVITAVTCKVWFAKAVEASRNIETSGTFSARGHLAFVHILFARVTIETGHARALETWFFVGAVAIVLTWLPQTFVDVRVAAFSCQNKTEDSNLDVLQNVCVCVLCVCVCVCVCVYVCV